MMLLKKSIFGLSLILGGGKEKPKKPISDPASLCAMLTSFNLRLFSPFHPFVSFETNTAPMELYVPTQCQLTNVKLF